jgi:hypothetical protein
MDYALQHGARVCSKCQTETTPEGMGVTARTAVSWALPSADIRALYADAVGISIFLLVSIRLGDRRLGTAGNRLSQTEDLNFLDGLAG